MDQGRFADAEREIRSELEDDIEEPFLFYLLAMAQLGLERPREAQQAAREAIALDPEFQLAFYALARCLIDRHRWAEAHKALDEAGRLDPEDADVDGLRAQIYASNGKSEEALAAAKAGLSNDPDNELCRFYHSLALSRKGEHAEAESVALELLADAPEEAEHHSIRGWTMAEAGNSKEAQRHFAEALRLDPDNQDARYGLTHAMKLSNPVTGWLLRGLMFLDRLPTWKLILGLVAIYLVSKRMAGSELPLVATTGHAVHTAVMLVIFFSIVIQTFTNAIIYTSPIGRQALLPDEKLALKWAAPALAIGLFFIGLWLWRGARHWPAQGIVWFSVAALAAECFESGNRWVRNRLAIIAALGCATALWVTFATQFIIGPKFIAALESLKALTPDEFNDPDVAKRKLHRPFLDALHMKTKLINQPVLIVMLVAVFRDNIRTWLVQRAPDSREF